MVNHIVSHEYRYADNLATNNSEYYVASRDDDFLGDDPHGSWPRGVALLDGAIAGLDSLDTTISFLLPLPARDVLLVRVFEAAMHPGTSHAQSVSMNESTSASGHASSHFPHHHTAVTCANLQSI